VLWQGELITMAEFQRRMAEQETAAQEAAALEAQAAELASLMGPGSN